MTQAIVVRMPREEVAAIDALAKSRKTNRSAILRQAARSFVRENKKQKGAGWPARLRELQRLGRKAGHKPIDWKIVEEMRAADRNRAWPL